METWSRNRLVAHTVKMGDRVLLLRGNISRTPAISSLFCLFSFSARWCVCVCVCVCVLEFVPLRAENDRSWRITSQRALALTRRPTIF